MSLFHTYQLAVAHPWPGQFCYCKNKGLSHCLCHSCSFLYTTHSCCFVLVQLLWKRYFVTLLVILVLEECLQQRILANKGGINPIKSITLLQLSYCINNSGTYWTGTPNHQLWLCMIRHDCHHQLWMYTTSSGCTPQTVGVHHKQWVYTTSSGCKPQTVGLHHKQWMHATSSECTPQAVTVYHKQWMHTINSGCTP